MVTADPQRLPAEAVAVAGGRIAAVGSEADVAELIGRAPTSSTPTDLSSLLASSTPTAGSVFVNHAED